MNMIIVQNIQNIWWAINSYVFGQQNIPLIILCVLSIFFGSLEYLFYYKNYKGIVFLLLYLLHNIMYTEACIQTPIDQLYNLFVSTLMIIWNQKAAIENVNLEWHLISKHIYLLYAVLRLASQGFIQWNFYIIEGITVLLLFIFLTQEKKQNEELKNQFTFQGNSKGSTLGKKFQKSRTHLSNIEKGDIYTNNPSRQFKPLKKPNKNIHAKILREKSYTQRLSVMFSKEEREQQYKFSSPLLNMLPEGLIIVDSQQKVKYMNSKCKKWIKDDSATVENTPEEILEKLRDGLQNAKIDDDDQPLQFQPKERKLTYKIFFEILKFHRQKQLPLDVFDLLLYPKKYLDLFFQNLSPYSQSDESKQSLGSQQDLYASLIIPYEMYIGQHAYKIKIIQNQMDKATGQFDQSFTHNSINKLYKSSQKIGEDTQPILMIFIKNTSRKQEMKLLQRDVSKLNNEKKLQNSLLKSFSHELKTPLNSIWVHIYLIKQKSNDDHIKLLSVQADISLSLLQHQINDILDYAAMQSGDFKYKNEVFNLGDMIQNLRYLYEDSLNSKEVKFVIDVDQRLSSFEIRSDKTRLIQVLVNLINNSSKFTNKGGLIVLKFEFISYNRLQISVKDDGVGIEFSKLTSIKKSLLSKNRSRSMHESKFYNDSGLGFKISARMVEGFLINGQGSLRIESNNAEQRGTIITFQVESIPEEEDDQLRNPMISEYPQSEYTALQYTNKIASFNNMSQLSIDVHQDNSQREMTHKLEVEMSEEPYSIELPRSPFYFKYTPSEINGVKSIPSDPNNIICRYCKSVLIVDDVPFNQIALGALLRFHNLEIDQAYDGNEAIQMVENQKKKHCTMYKLIFMDIEMPGMNGFECTKRILSITNGKALIVICSAYDTPENYQEGKEAGSVDFLPKPVKPQQLSRVLNKYLKC